MTRLAAGLVLMLAVVLVAFLASMLVGDQHDDLEPVTTSNTTSTTRWVETQPGLPNGFDPLKLTPTTRRAKIKARRPGAYPTDELLDRLAYCETGGTMDPATNTGNGYYGAFQFDIGTWWSVGGDGYPHEHPYSEQRDLARTLILQAGWGRFPVCSREIGAR